MHRVTEDSTESQHGRRKSLCKECKPKLPLPLAEQIAAVQAAKQTHQRLPRALSTDPAEITALVTADIGLVVVKHEPAPIPPSVLSPSLFSVHPSLPLAEQIAAVQAAKQTHQRLPRSLSTYPAEITTLVTAKIGVVVVKHEPAPIPPFKQPVLC